MSACEILFFCFLSFIFGAEFEDEKQNLVELWDIGHKNESVLHGKAGVFHLHWAWTEDQKFVTGL